MAVGIRAGRMIALAAAIGVAGLAGGDSSTAAVIMPPPAGPELVAVCQMPAPEPPPPESVSEDDWRPVAEPGAWTIGLLTLGQFHSKEVSARTGEVWLGLFPTDTGFALRPAALTIAPWDDDLGDGEGKEVKVETGTPLFLVNAGNRLHPRANVSTVFAGEVALGNAAYVLLAWRGVEHRLSVENRDSTPVRGIEFRDSRLTLTSSPPDVPDAFYHQKLVTIDRPYGEPWRLLWAGDLDGDGKLDLFVEVGAHDNVEDRRLFLSTAATKGQAVGQAAVFMTVGC
jgi:hypothetical protein